jgi:sugar O-acyltransferase (sialic acid O-acetyltransferase NeuD family)
MRILIIGAGGHAQVVVDALLRRRELDATVQPVGLLDDDPTLTGSELQGLPVLGSIQELHRIEHDVVVLAVGDNRVRAELFRNLARAGVPFASAVHPAAIVAPSARLGQGVVLCAGVVVNPVAEVGDNVILNTGCTVDHHCVIGPHAHLAPGSHLGGEVRVGEGALVGIGASVLRSVTIGDWAVVGVGAAVVHDVPPLSTVVGVPAKPFGPSRNLP